MTQAPTIQRKLTTILAADAANYSGQMAEDEVGTVQALRRSRAVFEKTINDRGGRIANTAGDGLIAEFPSVVEATAAAVAIQRRLTTEDGLLAFRIGLHLGDVIVDGADLLGDGVNVAARLQENAPEGGILASTQVVDHAKGRLTAEFRPLGPAQLKHLGDDIAVFGIVADGVTPPDDLERVVPQVTTPKDDIDIRARVLGTEQARPAPPSPPPSAPLPAPTPERETFQKTARKYGLATIGLGIVDFMGGAGPGWPSAVILVLAVLLYRKWRALPENAATNDS